MFIGTGPVTPSMVRVVVTGAAGFIGAHVARCLEQRGHSVVRTDVRAPAGNDGGWRPANLMRYPELVELTRTADAVCHLGGLGDVYAASSDPALAMSVNAVGTTSLLEASKRNGVRRFIFASTWEVYGLPQYQPIDELHPCSPSHPYSISKLAGDLITQEYNHQGSLNTVVLRLGTAFGPNMRRNAVIPAFILRALSGHPVEIHGTGNQFRQFTHVRDVASAFALALEAESPEPVYNIISHERVSVRDLAVMIGQRIPLTTVTRDPRPNDAPSSIVDAEKAGRSLGWRPEVLFEVGLNELIDAYLSDPVTQGI